MKTPHVRSLTLITATAFVIGCGSNEAPVRPVVKQEIAPDRKLKKFDPIEKKGKLRLATN